MTATQLRELVKGVVEAHDTHNTFYSIWSDVKDRETELTYPCAIWDQWRARLTEDEFGQLHRAVLVRLLVITAVATDRTPAQRDAAVEAADIAAADFILKIRQDYPDLTVTNVSTTTQFDEYTQLETGVLLTFTVEGEGLCLDADHFEPGIPGECVPGAVRNSDSSYTASVASGGTLVLPDVTHTDSDGSPVTLPGMEPFVATPCGPGDDAHVLINQTPVIDLGPGETWDLHVEYPDGTQVGSWNAGAERWEIPACPACDDATAVVKNTAGTTLDTEAIPSGGTEDIIIGDVVITIEDTASTVINVANAPSGEPYTVVAPDAKYQLKDSAGVNIGSPGLIVSNGDANITAPDATYQLKDSAGTNIGGPGAIVSNGSANIIAPDATAVLKNSEGTTLDTELIPSGVSENIVVADTTIQRKRESGVDIGVTIALPSGTGPHTVTCPNADVTVNNTPFTDVESGSEVDVVVANTDGTKVGSENAGVWEVPDATAVLKNSAGTTLDTEEIPSGGSEDIVVADAGAQLKDSAGTNIGGVEAIPSGVTENITAPDGTVKTTDGGTTVGTVKSNGTASLPQSVIKYKDAANADQVTAASNTEYSGGTLRPATQVPRRELTLDGVGTGDYVTLADLIANTVPDVTSPVIDRAITASWAAGDNETIPIILPAEYQGQTFAYVSNVGTNGTITVSVDGGSTFTAPPFTVGASGVAFRRTTYSGAGSVLYET